MKKELNPAVDCGKQGCPSQRHTWFNAAAASLLSTVAVVKILLLYN